MMISQYFYYMLMAMRTSGIVLMKHLHAAGLADIDALASCAEKHFTAFVLADKR